MNLDRRRATWLRLALLAASLLVGARAEAQHYVQQDLVSDQPGKPFADVNLVNPWGLARSSGSAWWAANNRTGTATLYNGNTGEPAPLIVTIPTLSGSGVGSPTGAVFNGTSAFEIQPGFPARFLFVTLDGTISGWNPGVDGTHAILKVANPGAAYTGVAIAERGGDFLLYVANFAQGRIEVYDSSFRRVKSADSATGASGDADVDRDGAKFLFRDRQIPSVFAPFNVQDIGGDLYVTFAKRDPVTTVASGPGLGFIDVFKPDGQLVRRLPHGQWLNAPWGVALAPGDFGAFSHNLLVGQFRSGEIAAYDISTGAFIGKMLQPGGDAPVAIEGLWAISFGNGVAGPLNTLFFTGGIENEEHGLFGRLTPVPTEQLLGNGR